MPSLDEIVQRRLRSGAAPAPGEKTDEVEKTAQHMKVVQDVKQTADQLSGADKLREQVDQTTQALRKTEQELANERQGQLKGQIQGLANKLDAALKDKGPSPEVTRLLQEIDNLKTQMVQGRFDSLERELKELKTMKASGATVGALDDQIKQIKAAAAELGLQAPSGGATSPEWDLKLEEMRFQHELTLARMASEDKRRDREWDLEKMKWADERAQRTKEKEGELAFKKEQLAMVEGFIKKLGISFAQGMSGTSQEITAGAVQATSQVLQASEGDFGEITCPAPGCGNSIGIARDAVKAICSKCGAVYPVQRIPREPAVDTTIESQSPG